MRTEIQREVLWRERQRGKNIDLWWSEIRNSDEWAEVRKHASCQDSETYAAYPLKQ